MNLHHGSEKISKNIVSNIDNIILLGHGDDWNAFVLRCQGGRFRRKNWADNCRNMILEQFLYSRGSLICIGLRVFYNQLYSRLNALGAKLIHSEFNAF